MKRKKNVLLLISAILGIAYVIYLVSYLAGANAQPMDSAEAAGAGIATLLVMPHAVCTAFAVIFNILGWTLDKRGFALTGAILYAVAIVFMPLYFMFTIVQCIISFIAFARMPKSPTA